MVNQAKLLGNTLINLGQIFKPLQKVPLILVFLLGCQKAQESKKNPSKITFTATTTQLADLLNTLTGGTDIEWFALMGPGVDPHLYQAKPRDLEKLLKSQFIIANGAYLEGKLFETLNEFSQNNPGRVFFLADFIPREKQLEVSAESQLVDPHFWFDISIWNKGVESLVREIIKSLPQTVKSQVLNNLENYTARLSRAEDESRKFLKVIPKNQRVLVTSHDAFRYWGKAYDFEVYGLQGISTSVEAGLGDMTRLGGIILSKGISTLFVESSVSTAAIEKLANISNTRLGPQIFSDALGGAGEMKENFDIGTLAGVHQYNAWIISHHLLKK
jgi:manganese/zinc/iron transport system substrate-binding protein